MRLPDQVPDPNLVPGTILLTVYTQALSQDTTSRYSPIQQQWVGGKSLFF